MLPKIINEQRIKKSELIKIINKKIKNAIYKGRRKTED